MNDDDDDDDDAEADAVICCRCCSLCQHVPRFARWPATAPGCTSQNSSSCRKVAEVI